MKLIEGDACIGEMIGYPANKRGRHVDAGRLDLLGCSIMLAQVRRKGANGRSVFSRRHEDHTALDQISHQRQVVVPSPARGFIDRYRRELREIGFVERELHIALANRVDFVPREVDHPGNRREWHLLAEHQHERFEEQGEAFKLADPFRLDQTYAAVRQANTRQAYLQIAFVLEEVQVPVALGFGVMDRVLSSKFGMRKARTGDEINADREQMLVGIELDALNLPRRLDSKSSIEERIGHHVITL